MCWDCYGNKGGDPYKIFTQGGVEVDDFVDEIPHIPSRKYKKKEKPQKKGCPGNDGKAHVYVWTTEGINYDNIFYRYYGFHKYEWQVCAGCMKRPSGRRRSSRMTEEFKKKFPEANHWGSPEYRDEGFMAFRKRYISKHGYGEALYYNWW